MLVSLRDCLSFFGTFKFLNYYILHWIVYRGCLIDFVLKYWQNVLIGDNGLLKLSDFGNAEYLTEANGVLHKGTAGYMAPEVLEENPYDTKCDIWSLGVLVYELCCLKKDFKKTNRNITTMWVDLLKTFIPVKLSPSETQSKSLFRKKMEKTLLDNSSSTSFEQKRIWKKKTGLVFLYGCDKKIKISFLSEYSLEVNFDFI